MAAEHALSFDMDGYAIGGLAVGEPTEKMYQVLELLDPIMPLNKPRYLMGVGTPCNLLEAIARGVDMFDCVMPTRNGRNGMLFTENGVMNMRNRNCKCVATTSKFISGECFCFLLKFLLFLF